MKCPYFIILFFIFFTDSASAQNNRFDHISVEQGLSQASGYATVRDKESFIWFGTQDGLNRYDGYNFQIFQNNPADSTTIVKNNIPSLLNYSDELLWVGTTKGLDIMNKKSGKFYRFHQYFKLKRPFLAGENIRKILSDKNSKIWIITWANGIYSFDIKTHQIQQYFYQNEQKNQNRDIFFDNQGNFWLATIDALHQFMPSKNQFKTFGIRQFFKNEAATSIRAAICDHQNNFWIGTSDYGVLVFQINDKAIPLKHFLKTEEKNSLSSNNIYCLTQDKNHHIWIGTRGGGICRYNPDTQTLNSYLYSESNPNSLSKNFVLSIYEDTEGIIWIGLSGGGFNKYDPNMRPFVHLKKETDNPESLSDNMVFSIKADSKQNLYVCTQSGGLVKIDAINKKIYTYKQDSDNTSNTMYNTVYDAVEDKKGNIWLATWAGLCLLDTKTSKSGNLISFSNEKIASTTFLYQLYQQKDSNLLWVSGQNGVFRFDTQRKIWLDWDTSSTFQPFLQSVVRVFQEDKNGILWIGTENEGLLCYDLKNNRLKQFTFPLLPSPTVRSLALDKGNILWIGTDNGLVQFHTKSEKIIKTYQKTADGLPNSVIYSILLEEDNVWIGTNNGLSCFNKSKKIFKNYDKTDGLQSNEFNTNAAYQDPKGLLYFGGINGITVFNPSDLQTNHYRADTKITGFKIFDQPYQSDTLISHLKCIQLSYKENFFSIEFAYLNHSQTSKNKYAYQLVGIDKDWVYCGNRRIASYTNLPSGNYTFRVKAANNDGIWGNEAVLEIQIIPPYWERAWFRFLLIFSVLGVLYGIYHYRVTQIRREANFRRQLAETEMAALRAQMNPHFIFNALSSIHHFTLSHDAKSAARYLTKFARLIRLVLENSREPKLLLSKELEAIEIYVEMESLRFSNRFDFVITIDPEIDADNIFIPPLLIQPYIENAIWHGLMQKDEAGTIELNISQPSAEKLHIEITDDGIGREKAKALKSKSALKKKSFGMKITTNRIEAINELYKIETRVQILDLIDAEGNPAGTKIILEIPI